MSFNNIFFNIISEVVQSEKLQKLIDIILNNINHNRKELTPILEL